ncbi:hypothetical protein Cal7507_1515 [Calothrix sp. PCC 7507]|nr:hypothetical protein Cal7507_1515 [Calothrix sp. PCC 7507]
MINQTFQNLTLSLMEWRQPDQGLAVLKNTCFDLVQEG